MQLIDSGQMPPITIQHVIHQCQMDSEAWFPDWANNLFFQAASAAGEAGEMVNEAKKAFRSVDANTPEQRAKVAEESIDVLIYLCCVWSILGIDPIREYNVKRAANAIRFGGSGPAGEPGPG